MAYKLTHAVLEAGAALTLPKAKGGKGEQSALLLLLVRLASRANEKGICWPSQAQLARDLGMCERYVRALIKRATEAGYVQVSVMPNSRGHKYKLEQRFFEQLKSELQGSFQREPEELIEGVEDQDGLE